MSGYFNDPPLYILETDDDLRDAMAGAIANPGEWKKKRWDTLSMTCYRAITALQQQGLRPYNSEVQREVERVLGIPRQPDDGQPSNGSILSTLVYKAQGYHRTDRLLADGYQPFTDEMIKEAFETKRKILVKLDPAIPVRIVVNGVQVPEGDTELVVNMIGGKLYAQRPRVRKTHHSAYGQPAKLGGKRR